MRNADATDRKLTQSGCMYEREVCHFLKKLNIILTFLLHRVIVLIVSNVNGVMQTLRILGGRGGAGGSKQANGSKTENHRSESPRIR